MDQKKQERRQTLLIASLIFGMFFGAGNLIFPIHLGQMAGDHWLLAAIGFILSGTLVPYLAMLAISSTNSDGLYDIARPVSHWFALFIVAAFHLVIGPFFATPRLPATAFATGVAPLLPVKYQSLGMLIYSAIFFGVAYLLTIKKADITAWVGKYLNPIFLFGLAALLIASFVLPMGNLQHTPLPAYQVGGIFQGFMEGYNTMDGLALLSFGITIVYALRGLGIKPQLISKKLAQAGALSIIAEAVIYFALILMGTMSLGLFKISDNGGIALAQIINHYAGRFGVIFTAVLITLAVLTTAMGLFQSFAQDMEVAFPKIAYRYWLAFIAIASFVVANFGLTNIIAWAVPVLMLLYPYALVLILLSLTKRWFNGAPIVYRWTITLVTLPALADMIAALPIVSSVASLTQFADWYHDTIPLSALGFGWLLPAIVGAGIGYGLYLLSLKH
ncbi:branched-chain amino acid transport system II carrier protein [Weissella diestrammenae]|uniref:Branched-chain amino acid transport system carrier protein n=1 Tax=Weissella diestrammenae TaxID=1162633 RepID=A0A7G9T6Y0_9LACO|nr:branched-chain amino acid transport system II carrier protein [Weissella diestrammenae]MCM0582549.1 branched-chain amino acid transport system II carrier protein [Weissella diestrammenae]QNN75855.1 branched-chain amino acid transport system II carrier protein [Weissella diestrammenae]